ncbi:MAG TPA: aminomethyl-transferring glycine dehydrogenase subunit GcvPB [Clostridiales bacterium]|jgi:glycine dehydrogenase subunit 2|nr:aminomethyl-transferring glycine dehydrogenase subunit GcvPB [Clostridiales bacterium]
MELIFEKSMEGRQQSILPACDVPIYLPSQTRETLPKLPQLTENELSRHYTALAKRTFGVNDGFYPLGSCTMKYNPKINDEMASLPGFASIHPLQPAHTVEGCLEVMTLAQQFLAEITGMDGVTLQPAAGAHGEFTGMMLIKAYHESRGDDKRKKIIVPDSAHGTNPASATMAGFEVVNIPSAGDGCVDLDALRRVCQDDTAGLMLTNPNTLGLFDPHILEITRIVHDAGGICYYDGANLNAIMGIVRPGDMGFDCVHVNLHKSFSTPHGGGGPGSGPVGCKAFLQPFLPNSIVEQEKRANQDLSIGKVRSFYGNFLVIVRALTYMLTLGREGIPAVAYHAVLHANYMMAQLKEMFPVAYDRPCMHEFVLDLSSIKQKTGVSALDVAKGLQDVGIHPPTMYFPLIVQEALMVEPTETESKETMDEAVEAFKKVYETIQKEPHLLRQVPYKGVISRPDEVTAARKPRIHYFYDK